MEERLIIVGAGLAGLSAAITAAQKGMKNVLVSLQPSERAQSVLAEGGISGELSGSAEGLEQHFQDTMKAGGYLADPEGVRRLVNAAPEVICGLRQLGTAFQMENGKLVCRRMGGHSRERTVFAKDQTGKAIMSALIDEARKYENEKTVLRMPHHDFLELMIQGDLCGGCVVKDRYTGEIRRLKGPVILASGGLSGLFPGCATGTVHNTGIVTAAAFRQGVELANLEFIQYHPTAFQIPGKRCLVSESARSEGGRLMARRNQSKWYFMEDIYGADGNLASRDVISREMEKIYRRPDCDHQIWMDMTAVPSEAWRSKLSGMRSECMDYLQIDPMKNPVPVEPGVHYFMGGILTDIYHRTSKRFLYAAGECACQYHGANRLGGNSMLGAVFGGMTAAAQAAAEWGEFAASDTGSLQSAWEQDGDGSLRSGIKRKIGDILYQGMGIIRSEEGLNRSLAALKALGKSETLTQAETDESLLGMAMLRAALERRESRGAHWREDYPESQEAFRKTTVVSYDGQQIKVRFRQLPEPMEG